MCHRAVSRIVDAMVLTILLATPGLLILLVLAATPLFRLWDDRASERPARGAPAPCPELAIPAPRPSLDPVRPTPATR